MKRKSQRSTTGERGAAAVEFALVAPILLALVAGIVEFSHAYNLQISVAQAAREAAREMAIEDDQDAAALAATAGAPGLSTGDFEYAFSPGTCTAGENMTVTITYPAATLTGIFGSTVTVTGTGAMRCEG
ncbi:TadE family protein [Arthrobacter sp. AFG20]|uniref:TadE family protein n=1 Tax=Arthrobacter sp. AFG20 TaxID=1688671 RepID=UPI000C9E30DA|nr:TadE/TadG family type IV pilus assembly protein [Arthrobacter sp. AFG20]PNH81135.1 TadE family protein [Arthrobacter sp. AFG20]